MKLERSERQTADKTSDRQPVSQDVRFSNSLHPQRRKPHKQADTGKVSGIYSPALKLQICGGSRAYLSTLPPPTASHITQKPGLKPGGTICTRNQNNNNNNTTATCMCHTAYEATASLTTRRVFLAAVIKLV